MIVLLMGYAVLSAAGLVGFAAADVAAREAANNQPPPTTKRRLPIGSTTSVAVATLADKASPEIALGDALFKANCTQCHAVNEQMVGPALGGIGKRRPITWIIPWVHNSAKVVASSDEYAVNLYNKFQKQQMPSFTLSDKEIKAIVVYIESQEALINAGVAGQAVAANETAQRVAPAF